MFSKRSKFWSLFFVLLLIFSLAVVGCGSNEEEPNNINTPQNENENEQSQDQQEETVDEFALLQAQADAYLSSGKAPTISADDVFNAVVSEDPNYFILSIRSAEHYAAGHIKGAANIPFKEIWKEENLAQLPTDKTIVVVCYTGHTASQTTAFLNLLGYDAVAMKFGMMGWTSDPEVLNTTPFTGVSEQYPLETDVNALTETYEAPVLNTGKADVNEIIKARAEAYLTSGSPATIAPGDVFSAVAAEDANTFILSIRSAEHYGLGHIPGAHNIPYAEVAKLENLQKLPKDKKIVVICYTGHTASQTAMILNLLGYDAVPMKFGMMSWTDNPDVLITQPFTSAPDYPVE